MKYDKEQSYSDIMNKENVSGVILYLLHHGESKNIDLQVVVANHYRRHELMNVLRDAGIVDIDFQVSPKKEYRYNLTDKGKRIGEKLEEIEEILSP